MWKNRRRMDHLGCLEPHPAWLVGSVGISCVDATAWSSYSSIAGTALSDSSYCVPAECPQSTRTPLFSPPNSDTHLNHRNNFSPRARASVYTVPNLRACETAIEHIEHWKVSL